MENKGQLYVELQSMTSQGILLFLDGRPSSPEYVTHVLCKEDGSYMRDYIYDETEGVLRELHFDKLSRT